MTAQSLVAGNWDIVIVSYHFLSKQYRAMRKFEERLQKYRETGAGSVPKRPIGGVASNFWELFDLPVKRLILDECHIIKNEGTFYEAVKAVHRRATIMLSGTVMSNRWVDVANLVTMLNGHPFATRQKFVRAFSLSDKSTTIWKCVPDVVSLQRFLLAIMLARPSDSLSLPHISHEDAIFQLEDDVEWRYVQDATEKYERARSASEEKGARTSDSANQVMGLAVKAQLYAAHAILGMQADDIHQKVVSGIEIDDEDDLDGLVVRLVDLYSRETVKSRSDWLDELASMEISDLKASSRVKAFCSVLRRARRNFPHEKIIVFSSYLRFLDILHRVIKQEFNIDALRYDGTLSSAQKTGVQEAFTDPASSPILLITSGCGSVGLNLQSASVVIQTEVWWNHNTERQAYARCHRGGQTVPVKVFRLFASNSAIDAVMRTSQTKKTQTNDSIMNLLVRRHDATIVIPPYQANVF
jgi:SNF2 family DNA or RNA helicase